MQERSDQGGQTAAAGPRRRLLRATEWTLLMSRWLMVPLILPLLAFPLLIAWRVWLDVAKLALGWAPADRYTLVLTALHSIDLVLVAGLVLMVALSAYEETVSRMDVTLARPSWLGKVDSGGLKLKVVLSILAIATIELLATSLGVDRLSDRSIEWMLAIYGMFLLGTAVMVGALRVTGARH